MARHKGSTRWTRTMKRLPPSSHKALVRPATSSTRRRRLSGGCNRPTLHLLLVHVTKPLIGKTIGVELLECSFGLLSRSIVCHQVEISIFCIMALSDLFGDPLGQESLCRTALERGSQSLARPWVSTPFWHRCCGMLFHVLLCRRTDWGRTGRHRSH